MKPIEVKNSDGNVIGQVNKTDGKWESQADLSELGHWGAGSKEEAIEDVKKTHAEFVHYYTKRTIIDLESLESYLCDMDKTHLKALKQAVISILLEIERK